MPSFPKYSPRVNFCPGIREFPTAKKMQYNTKRHARTRVDPYQRPAKVFLLSPALLTGARAKQLLSPRAQFPAAQSFRSNQGVPIADAFSFLSCLYFRGKMAYAKHFATPPLGWTGTGIYVITPGFGLVPPEWILNPARMQQLQQTPVDPKNRAYRVPLEQHAEALAEQIGRLASDTSVVLLGSIATGKYVDLLWPIFQERLLYPCSFAGVGEMSRGALMLRAARSGEELDYDSVESMLFRTTARRRR